MMKFVFFRPVKTGNYFKSQFDIFRENTSAHFLPVSLEMLSQYLVKNIRKAPGSKEVKKKILAFYFVN